PCSDEGADGVQGVVERVRDAGGEFADRGELASLDELLLLLMQLRLTALDVQAGLSQVAHDVNHRLAAVLEADVRVVEVLEDVHQGSPRVMQPLGLPGETPAIIVRHEAPSSLVFSRALRSR